MGHENSLEYTITHEAAEDASHAASVSEIMNRETPTGKLWPFLGGIAIGAAGVIANGIAIALVADALTYGEGGESGQPDEEMLKLPEGDVGNQVYNLAEDCLNRNPLARFI